MRCAKIRHWISSRADGALDAARVGAVETHVAGCPSCAAFARSVDETASALRRWHGDEPRAGFADRVLARVEGEAFGERSWRERLSWLRPAPVGLAAAAFVCGVLLSLAMEAGGERRGEGRDPVVTAGAETFDPLPQDSTGARLLAILNGRQE